MAAAPRTPGPVAAGTGHLIPLTLPQGHRHDRAIALPTHRFHAGADALQPQRAQCAGPGDVHRVDGGPQPRRQGQGDPQRDLHRCGRRLLRRRQPQPPAGEPGPAQARAGRRHRCTQPLDRDHPHLPQAGDRGGGGPGGGRGLLAGAGVRSRGGRRGCQIRDGLCERGADAGRRRLVAHRPLPAASAGQRDHHAGQAGQRGAARAFRAGQRGGQARRGAGPRAAAGRAVGRAVAACSRPHQGADHACGRGLAACAPAGRAAQLCRSAAPRRRQRRHLGLPAEAPPQYR
ncbi:hypothetical protein ACEQUB_02107 [Ralstonia syzygii]